MQIPITSVEYVSNLQTVSIPDVINTCQNFRKLGSGYRCILNKQVWSNPPHCSKGFFPSRPELHTVFRISGPLNFDSPLFKAALLGSISVQVKAGFGTVKFNHESGSGLKWVTSGKHTRFDRLDCRPIYNFHCCRHQARGYDFRNCSAC